MEQYRLLPFLERYDTVLFDLDGVLTSEEMYWNCAALAVYEMYFGKQYYGSQALTAQEMESRTAEIRKLVFCNDRLIRVLKDKGVNSNWDLAYITLSAALYVGAEQGFEETVRYLEQIPGDAFACYREVAERLANKFHSDKGYFERLGAFWMKTQTCFQEWFLGDELFFQTNGCEVLQKGKRGMVHSEEPLVDKQRMQILLRLLYESGKCLGVGSGRPRPECIGVLEQWEVMRYFAPECMISYSNVTEAEDVLAKEGIRAEFTKPHPFMFLKGGSRGKLSDLEIYRGDYRKEDFSHCLVIGDAAADLFAAKAAGCDFAAVLTGVQGKKARGFFEEEKADYILEDVLAMMTKQK